MSKDGQNQEPDGLMLKGLSATKAVLAKFW